VSIPGPRELKLISAGLLTIIRKNKAKSKEMRVLFLYVHYVHSSSFSSPCTTGIMFTVPGPSDRVELIR